VNAFERGKKLLEFLGTPVARPKPVRDEMPSIGGCKNCSATGIVWATAPSGKRVPLDHHPEGDLVLVAGNAIPFGPAHEGLRRFVVHFTACREAQAKRGSQ
jgi:fructose-specific component phosphotransferase system IIB-like protein